jgi:deoxyribodipyrimidine photolyase-related protein
MTTLRIILGDQLSHSIASLQGCDKTNDIILMAEVMSEATYVKHHKKKLFFYFQPCATLRKSSRKKDTNYIMLS